MGYPTDDDFREAHGWFAGPRFSEADRKRLARKRPKARRAKRKR